MTKKTFEADFKADEVIKFLEKASKQVSDLRPLMKVASHFLKSTVDENFKTEGAHTGDKWKEWSDNWKKRRLKIGKGQGKILSLEGSLRRDIRSKYDNTTASVISNKEYAATHNFGCDKTVMKERYNKKKGAKTRFTCKMNTPKREFMRINEREQEYLIADLTVKLKEILMNNGHSN